ncbi:Uncharacterized protein Fot_09970 [Forsythia ovata]|uniref:Uncharacterized protein n=1 Tax=Forsythia ovata TaxID=205694 RepID=A0ABD1WG70_9LAMI
MAIAWWRNVAVELLLLRQWRNGSLAVAVHHPRQQHGGLCPQAQCDNATKPIYFLPFVAESINKQIEEAILRADRMGVKVISLPALNKIGESTAATAECRRWRSGAGSRCWVLGSGAGLRCWVLGQRR